MASTIAKAKEIRNVSIGEVGVLFNLNLTAELDYDNGKIDFDGSATKADGWVFYGLTGQDTKLTTDIKVFDAKVGVPEYILKRFLVGEEGTITGNFLEADLQVHDLIAGNRTIKNYFRTADTAKAIVSEDLVNHTIDVVNADATALYVGNTVVVDVEASLPTSMNTARITAKSVGPTNTTLSFSESWFITAPNHATMKIQQPQYSVSQIGASELTPVQVMMFYETAEGVQFIYHFPEASFTPNISPMFSNTGELYKLPFELKIEGVVNDEHFDGGKNILGYYYELMRRETA